MPAGAGGVALNLTAAGPAGRGYLTVYPCGQGRPDGVEPQRRAGVTRANQTVVALDSTGDLCIFTSVTTHVIADLAGWYGGQRQLVPPGRRPTRVLDTRQTGGRGP